MDRAVVHKLGNSFIYYDSSKGPTNCGIGKANCTFCLLIVLNCILQPDSVAATRWHKDILKLTAEGWRAELARLADP